MDLLNNDQFLTPIIILNLVQSTFRLILMEWHQLLRKRMSTLTGVMILGKSLQPLRGERIARKKDVSFAALVPMESESPRTECFEHRKYTKYNTNKFVHIIVQLSIAILIK